MYFNSLKLTSERVGAIVLGSVGLEEGRGQARVGARMTSLPEQSRGKGCSGRGNSESGAPEVRNSTGNQESRGVLRARGPEGAGSVMGGEGSKVGTSSE